MKTLLSVLLLCIPSTVMAATSGWTTGNNLNGYLNAETGDYFSKGVAAGYISAVADQAAKSTQSWLRYVASVADNKSLTAKDKNEQVGMIFAVNTCFPSNVTRGQLVAVVTKWLSAHPERWNENAATLVGDALREVFPCKAIDDFMK